MELLQAARQHLSNAPYPEDFAVGKWWASRQAATRSQVLAFQNPGDVIRYAQVGSLSGFDHRIPETVAALRIARFKLRELEREYAWTWSTSVLEESSYSIGTVTIEGKRCSSIFLSHVNALLRIQRFVAQPKRILEIGGGYGALARIVGTAHPGVKYTIIDFPESLFYAHIFLGVNFPSARIDSTPAADFRLVPIQECLTLSGETFDVAVNTGSLQEMPARAVAFWMQFIQERIATKLFYSFNYFLVNKGGFNETEGSNLICPVLDPYWAVRHFEINPPVTTVDADGRNWLEVMLERDPARDPTEKAQALFEEAQGYPMASNYSFSALWMAIWCDPRAEYIEAMIHAIERFRDAVYGAGPRNYQQQKRTILDLVKNVIKRLLFPTRGIAIDKRAYSELTYYRRLLDQVTQS